MKKSFSFPNNTRFSYDTETAALTLTDLCGMTCGHNMQEDDYSCSGLAVVCVDEKRLEGAKWKYEILSAAENSFHFAASDAGKTVSFEALWKFEPEYDLINCHFSLTNTSEKTVVIRRALPRWVFTPGEYNIYSQMSRWNSENILQCQTLRGADVHLHGRAARSTVGSTPFCVIRDEENMSAAAFHVFPRGNWTIDVHSDIISNEAPAAIVEAGLADTDLFMTLQPGERIELPEILIQDLPMGDLLKIGAPIQKYMIRKRLPDANLHQPPVVYNGWLYRFTDFTREQLSQQLQTAKAIGCEVFIVDAGWFGGDSGWSQVGDWREKEGAPFYGNMKAFADEVRAAGLKFGFWMEPERFAEGIPVRTAHPEWFPEHSIRIDLTQPAAAKYFREVIIENVKKFGAEYIKLDFNVSVGYDESGSELYNYCTILNKQMQLIRKECPNLIIENCGSGSLRNDLSTALIYDHAFISDNAHPFETLRIRQGTFMRTLPGRTLNWIVMRPAPERRTKISESLQVLACTAATWDEAALFDLDYVLISGLMGVPGFSGELAEFEPEIKQRISSYVSFYKENRKFFTDSHMFLLTAPDSSVMDYEKYLAFQMQGDETTDSLLFVFGHGASRRAVRNFRLQELDPTRNYRVKKLFDNAAEEIIQSGAELMRYGVRTILQENQHVRHTAGLYQISAV